MDEKSGIQDKADQKNTTVQVASDGAKELEKEEVISPTAAYFKLWSFALPLDVALRTLAAVCFVGAGTAEPLMTLFFGKLVNLYNNETLRPPAEFRSEINKNALYLVYLFIGKLACLYAGAVLFNITSARMTSRIRLLYLSTVLHQPISFFDKISPGSIATSLANDTNVVQVALSERVGLVFQVSSMIVTSFIIAFTKNWKLTLVTATVFPYMMITSGAFAGINTNVEAKVSQLLNQASGIAEEALSSVLNITAMGAVDKMVTGFDALFKQAYPYMIAIGPIQAGMFGNMFLTVHSAYALALFYGVKLVNRGEIGNGGSVIIVLFCMVIATSSVGYLMPVMTDFGKAGAAAQQITTMIGQPKDSGSSLDRGKRKRLKSLHGDIELRGLTFRYPERPEVTVLGGVSLRIPANKVTALVGHSGSGKSTIIGLLEKWYAVDPNSIFLDCEDITQLESKWLREQIGLVQQEPVLFNDTIYQNVANGLRGPGCESLPEDKKRQLVIAACKQANAHTFIEKLPHGYDTPAGERAGLLSGGQKQRIAIARSIVADPKILLLDEATSALDAESERAVTAALNKASQGRTTILIAHKLATVVNADNIVVLDKGIIQEQGTHTELLALNGHYCRLLQAQRSSDSEGNNGAHAAEQELELTRTISRKLTHESTKGQAAEKDPSPLERGEISRRHSFFHSLRILYSEHPSLIWLTIIGLAAALVLAAAWPVQAFLFSKVITIFQLQGRTMVDRGNFWALMFFVLGLTMVAGFLVLFYFMGLVGARFGVAYRRAYFNAMIRQDISFFQTSGNTSGGLTALLMADATDLTTFFSISMPLIVVFAVELIACCVLSIAVYWKLGLATIFGCLPPILGTGFARLRLETTAQDRCAAAFLESARYSTEAVAAIRTVSSLTMEEKVKDLYHSKLRSASVNSFKQTLLPMVFYSLSDALVLAAMAFTFWYGGRLLSFGELSAGQFFIIYSAILFGAASAGMMFGYAGSLAKVHAAMNRILYLTHFKPAINSSTGLDPSSETESESEDGPIIEIHDVHFSYPSRPTVPVLRGVSLSAPRGSHICVVGPSGCGKSTIVALLERFYDLETSSPNSEEPGHNGDSGAIHIYGRPITDWDIAKLRKTIGLVSQETTLYTGTIRENILLGLPSSSSSSHVTDEEDAATLQSRIERACTLANIHAFITSLPQGYNTPLGARGVALSGGQRQRLALARCLIREPKILLLDEATSALDPESESAVREALEKARHEASGASDDGKGKGLTVVSVTHHIESMRDADKIFVLDGGVVVEEGSWEELMGKKGRLWGMVVKGDVEGDRAGAEE